MTVLSRRPRALLSILTWLTWTASGLHGQAAGELGDDLIADLFVGLTSFTLSENLVGATYRVDTTTPGFEDSHLTTFKMPWGADLDVGKRTDVLHVDVIGGLLLVRDRATLAAPSGDSRFSQHWTAYGLRGGVGWNFRPHGGWIVRPGVGASLTRIENEAEFDALGQAELEPLLDGILVNWEAWALGLEASLALINEQRFGDVRSRFGGRWSVGTVEVFSATSDFQEGSSSARHVALRSDFDGPTRWRWSGDEVRWELFLAYEGYSKVERDALGFDQLYEVGTGLAARPFQRLPPLSLTVSWITGPGIEGWSLGLSLAR